jgi:hypothetical protein
MQALRSSTLALVVQHCKRIYPSHAKVWVQAWNAELALPSSQAIMNIDIDKKA